MIDYWNRIVERVGIRGPLKKMIDHNRFATLGGSVAFLSVVFHTGCQPTTVSPISGEAVTQNVLKAELDGWTEQKRAEAVALESEVKAMSARVGAALEDLEARQARIQAALDAASSVLPSVAGPWGALAGIVIAGLAGDNARKSVKIRQAKARLVKAMSTSVN